MSLMRNNCHSPLTSDDMCVPVETVALQDTKTDTEQHKAAACRKKQSTKVINILVELRADIQKLHLQEGSPDKCITLADLALNPP